MAILKKIWKGFDGWYHAVIEFADGSQIEMKQKQPIEYKVNK